MEIDPFSRKPSSLDPNNPERWHRLFYAHELTRNYGAAAEALDRASLLIRIHGTSNFTEPLSRCTGKGI